MAMAMRTVGWALVFASALGALGCGDSDATGGGGSGGGATPIVAEAGFVEVPPAALAGPNYASKMFFSFIPADRGAEDAPILVFFNGGPGAATTAILAPYGTGPYRLDPDAADDAGPIPNPDSYTRFANLLYIDERMAGFSYGVRPQGMTAGCIGNEPYYSQDAGDFLFTLLTFLDAHPALTDNPVVVVGESYGGTRAPLMLHLLRHYAFPPEPPLPLMVDIEPSVPWLHDMVQAHYDLLTPGEKRERTPDEVAEQFGWMVMIQPNFFGQMQNTLQLPLLEADPDFAAYLQDEAAFDAYDVRKPASFGDHLAAQVDATIHDPERLALLLGVHPKDVPGLPASQRGDAFRLFLGLDAAKLASDEAPLRAALGELGPDDTYWETFQVACGDMGDTDTANVLLRLLPSLRTFITNARYDAVVYTEAIAPIFATTGYDVTIDLTAPVAAERPGEMHFVSAERDFRVRFPTYEAGHEVTVSAWQPFGEDLEAWLVAEGAIRP